MNFRIPIEDQNEFGRLPERARDEILVMLECLRQLHDAGRGNMRKKAAVILSRISGMRGATYQSLNRKLNRYVASGGDWRVIIDERITRNTVGLPDEFSEYFRGKYNANQRSRSGRAALRAIMEEWYAGYQIPGYGTWQEYWLVQHDHDPIPAMCPEWFVPSGWTYSNIMRYKPKRAEAALAKYGIAAARQELIHIPQTRLGMRFLEWITLDDVETDFLIRVDECESPVVLKCIVAKDIATDLGLRFNCRPRLPRDDGTTEGLKRRDTLVVIADLFCTFGFPVDYICNIILERGTASVSEADAKCIYEITGGHVVIHFTEMIRGKALPHGFEDRAIGNPSGKSWLESSFNLLHNEAGALPGQKGSLYSLRPMELKGREEELREIVKAGRFMPPELRAQSRYPFLNYREATLCLEEILRRMNSRTWHKLEGFDEVGIWRWKNDHASPWRPMTEYPVGLATEAYQDIILDKRPESPLERLQKLIQGYRFEKVAESMLPLLLEKHHETVTVSKGIIEIQIDKKPYRFRDEKSGLMIEGAKYLAYYSRRDLESAMQLSNKRNNLAHLFLTDGRGAYLGKLPLRHGITRGDVEKLSEAIAEKTRELKAARMAVAKGLQWQAKKRLEDIQHELELLENASAKNIAPEPDSETAATPGSLAELQSDAAAVSARVAAAQDVDIVEIINRRAKENT